MEPSDRDSITLKEVCADCGKPVVSTHTLTQWILRQNICQCKRLDNSHSIRPGDAIKPNPTEKSQQRLEPASRRQTGQNQRPEAKRDTSESVSDIAREFEKYKIVENLGEGNIHSVYRAEMIGFDKKELAIKVVRQDLVPNNRSAKRFLQEAGRAMKLDHPHIAGVYDCGVTSTGLPYQVTDYINGTSLSAMLQKEGFLDVKQVMEIAIQLTEALAYAHDNGVVHRGIRTSNVFVQRDARGSQYVKLLDFGVSRVLPNTGRETKFFTAQGGEDFGDPIYMSPEQCLGKKLDHRTDIYSLGCVLYECLCGKPPVEGLNPMQTAVMKVGTEAKPLNKRFNDLDIPDDLDAIVMLCLAISPDNRYQTINELHEDLELVHSNRAPKLHNRKRAAIPKESPSHSDSSKNLPSRGKAEVVTSEASGPLAVLRHSIMRSPVVSTMVLAFVISGLVTALILLMISGLP